MSATESLLDFVAATHVLPPAVRVETVRLLGDTLAVGAAGATAPGADGVLAVAMGAGTSGTARVLGRTVRMSAPSAAFTNGFQIHCLEWDAVHEPAVVHAMSVVTSGLHAAIDRRGGCDPDTAIAALAIGVDVASGLGIAAHSPLTFFRPATAGLIGAALAIARIEGIDRDRLPDVLGLAHSFCAGTMQAHVEGSIALPLQIAHAAQSAVQVVDLVKNGLTGPHNAVEGPFGYFKTFDEGRLDDYTDTLGTVWRISEISTKPYPSGRASHAVLGEIAALGLNADDILWIEVCVPSLIKRLVGRPMMNGMTPAYARLCLPLLTALMMKDGRIDPRRFVPDTFADPGILDLAGRVVVTVDDNPDPNALGPQSLTITLKDGSGIKREIPHSLGAPLAPLDAAQSLAKYDLARALAVDAPDMRVFDDPLSYFICPEQP